MLLKSLLSTELSLCGNCLVVLVEPTTVAPITKVAPSTLVAGVLAVVYGTAGFAALVFIVLPKLMAGAGQAAAAGGSAMAASAVRPPVRWSPRFANDFLRPGSYLPRDVAPNRVSSSATLLRLCDFMSTLFRLCCGRKLGL